ncbi:fumarylacetoacetate hydrolase family protein [Acuticoccus sp. M5D2P5]|uniref:2-keto-4-pentenoate hydratase n=1 Tax=Acuticoccus kalidii TaxID=2910977 RepID=UPI001F433A30|nr:fumarylacetoacetate hydrolase family protein [Acuticoccus kalidii]MCF3936465.1 fumarylacetoacetate hydrolase family protein [Acuticoccus kalidii]
MSDAKNLAAAFRGEGPLAGLDHRPATVAEGYDLQDKVRAEIGGKIIGWKLAQTTKGAQAAAGIDAPTVAPLLEDMIVDTDTAFPPRRFYKPEAEAEIAIELAKPIEGPVSAEEVRAAAKGIRLAIEIADTRYVDKKAAGIASNIADMNSCGLLVVGELMPLDLLDKAVAANVTTKLGDGTIVEALPPEGRPDPLNVIAFLSRFVSERGHTLPAGLIITTGTHTAPTLTAPGLVVATFEGIGHVSTRLAEHWS